MAQQQTDHPHWKGDWVCWGSMLEEYYIVLMVLVCWMLGNKL